MLATNWTGLENAASRLLHFQWLVPLSMAAHPDPHGKHRSIGVSLWAAVPCMPGEGGDDPLKQVAAANEKRR